MQKPEIFRIGTKRIELYTDIIPASPTPSAKTQTIRVVRLIEPPSIMDKRALSVRMLGRTFDFLLTYHPALLKYPHACYCPAADCWVKKYDHETIKQFTVSFICGFKRKTIGHVFRQMVWNNAHLMTTPKNWYISRYSRGLYNPHGFPVIGNSKIPLFTSQFHIVIENSAVPGYFTEKLIDALYTKTVPIYYGDPNISQHFDIRGMFLVSTLHDIVRIVNGLTPNTYESMKEYVDINYERSKKYTTSKVPQIIQDLVTKWMQSSVLNEVLTKEISVKEISDKTISADASKDASKDVSKDVSKKALVVPETQQRYPVAKMAKFMLISSMLRRNSRLSTVKKGLK